MPRGTTICLHLEIAKRLASRSAKAASGGAKRQRNSADLAAGSESVLREFLKRDEPSRIESNVFGYLKFACTLVSLEIVTVHVGAVPAQAPVQLTKFRPAAGVAVRFTTVPSANLAEQLLPQLIWVDCNPAGFPVTVPLPPRPMDSV